MGVKHDGSDSLPVPSFAFLFYISASDLLNNNKNESAPNYLRRDQ